MGLFVLPVLAVGLLVTSTATADQEFDGTTPMPPGIANSTGDSTTFKANTGAGTVGDASGAAIAKFVFICFIHRNIFNDFSMVERRSRPFVLAFHNG